MMDDIYNAHTHIFTGNCAPKDFLQVGLKMNDGFSRLLKWLFLTRPVSWIITKFAGLIPKKQLQFLKIGVMASQNKVLEDILDCYSPSVFSNIKIVALTLDMDYMTDPQNKPSQNFSSQIQEIVKLKKTYADRLFPFYGIDPRNPETLNPKKFKEYITSKTFAGIKLYPAKGFFPFDPRLDEIYKFASENSIPVMTHCTRSGSYFVGKNVWSLIPPNPPSLNPASSAMPGIYARIAAEIKALNGSLKENKRACNQFSHPENYIPVLEKYKNLKLCIAHLGGSSEIEKPAGQGSWYEYIRDVILKNFPCAYSDISYALASAKAMQIVNGDIAAKLLPADRILFGTDYFMVEQEGAELEVVAVAQKELANYLSQMMSSNVKKYLFEKCPQKG